MAVLATAWGMIELFLIPPGLLKRCFYLSFYIHPILWIPFQFFLWLKILEEWPLAILILFRDMLYFVAVPVYRLSQSVAICCFSLLGISTTPPPDMESEPVNLQIVQGSSNRSQTQGTTTPTPTPTPTPTFHSFSFSCAAGVPYQLIMFPVPILSDEDDSDEDDDDDDDSDFLEASMYLEHDPDADIGLIEFFEPPSGRGSNLYPDIDDESSDSSRKGRFYPSLDSIWNDDPPPVADTEISEISTERLYPSLGSLWHEHPSSVPSLNLPQTIDEEIFYISKERLDPGLGSIWHEHPLSFHSSSPPQAIEQEVHYISSTEGFLLGPESIWNPAREFGFGSSPDEEEVVAESNKFSPEEGEDFNTFFLPSPYGLPQVDWFEIPPDAANSKPTTEKHLEVKMKSAPSPAECSSSSSLFSPEVDLSFKHPPSVIRPLNMDVNNLVSEVKNPEEEEEVEPFDFISKAIREAEVVISRVTPTDIRNEVDLFYGKYEERMRWFDVLNKDRTHGISAIHEQLLETGSPLNEIEPDNLSWSKAMKKRLLKSLESDLELVYVAQASLSWEALHYQFRKVEAIPISRRGIFYQSVVGEYQNFQVLLERFIEEPKQEGKRYLKYVHTRHSFKTLLQVPELPGYVKKVEKHRERAAVEPKEVLKAIEKCIEAFYHFIKADKDKAWWKIKNSVWIASDPPVEDPRDLLLLADLTKRHQEKELQLKDIQGKKWKLWKKRGAPLEESERREMMFTVIDLKLVQRVLQMGAISSTQLKWCQQKLDNISFRDRKVPRVVGSCTLFPTS